MFDRNHLPELYRKMYRLGYMDRWGHRKRHVWLAEMKWMSFDEVINYQYEDDVTQEVLPFALTGGGDLWVFIENGTKEPYVGRHFHPEDKGQYYAENLAGAILRNIIEFAADPSVWLDENGEIKEIDYSEEEMRCRMKKYYEIFDRLLPQKYLEVIRQLSEESFKICACHKHGHWLALLSNEEKEAMVRHCLYFDLFNQTFAWYPEET